VLGALCGDFGVLLETVCALSAGWLMLHGVHMVELVLFWDGSVCSLLELPLEGYWLISRIWRNLFFLRRYRGFLSV
jgi:hypothetical protein